MSSSSDQTTVEGERQQTHAGDGTQQATQPQQQGGADMRLLAIYCAVGLIFNMGFVMLLFLSAEIAGSLAIGVMMVATSIFTGFLVVRIAESAGIDLMRKIEGR